MNKQNANYFCFSAQIYIDSLTKYAICTTEAAYLHDAIYPLANGNSIVVHQQKVIIISHFSAAPIKEDISVSVSKFMPAGII